MEGDAPMSQVETANTVLSLFDQIVSATDDGEILAKVASVRQHLGGEIPSIVIKQLVVEGEQTKQAAVEFPIEDGFYDLADFLAALQRKMGRTYGWRVDLVKATMDTEGVRPVKNEEIQRWQQEKRVPEWAMAQLPKLVFGRRKGENGPPWSSKEYDFLVALYKGAAICSLPEGDPTYGTKKDDKYPTDSDTSNAEFSRICSNEFGRTITENGIKGAIDRRRKRGELPEYRKDSSKKRQEIAAQPPQQPQQPTASAEVEAAA